MKKYNKPMMKVHTCALSNEVLRCCCCGSGCNCGCNCGGAKATEFNNINFEEDE